MTTEPRDELPSINFEDLPTEVQVKISQFGESHKKGNVGAEFASYDQLIILMQEIEVVVARAEPMARNQPELYSQLTIGDLIRMLG